MKRTILYTLAAAAAVATVACCPCRFSKKFNLPLVGTTWQLSQIGGRDISIENGTFEITFGIDGKITGVGSCNRFNAPYEITDKGDIDVGMIVSTRMFCKDAETEQQMFRELDGATHYEITGPRLLILNNGEIRAIFSAPESDDNGKAKK